MVNMSPITTPVAMPPVTLSSAPATTSARVLSVDILRGITIAFMILVNDPGDWSHVYSQLDHAKWNGWTLTDLVFPSFLFLVGMSIIFSFQSRLSRGDSRLTLAGHLFRRAAIIFAIKMFLSAYPHFHIAHIRIYGVLTRIALCYLFAGLICLGTRKIVPLACITAGLLIGYWALMRFVPVPGFGVPTRDIPLLDPIGNLTAWIDRGISAFTLRTINMGRLYRVTRDPEGLLSTLPAIATTLLGSITAVFMRSPAYTPVTKRNVFALAGAAVRRRRRALEPHLPHQQKSLDQLLRPPRRGHLPVWAWRSSTGSSTCSASRTRAASPKQLSGPGWSSAPMPSPPSSSPSSS